jgi:hypothetical protein
MRVAVLLILVMILIVAAWSKLRLLDENSDQPQRWRVEDFPRLQQVPEQTD